MAYAVRTKVPARQTKGEIEDLVKRHGADAFGIMEHAGSASVAFRLNGRNILFRVGLAEGKQEERSLWRALLLTIKAKLESVERGIETFEEAFLPQTMTTSGRTVYEEVAPRLVEHYSGENTEVPLLPKP